MNRGSPPRAPDAHVRRADASGQRRVIRFVGAFATLLLVFFLLSRTEYFIDTVSPASIALNTGIAAVLLDLMGEDGVARGDTLYGSRLSLTIANACDAAEPLQLYAAAVLASPAPTLLRALGLVGGGLLILLLNQIRIVTLYFAGVYAPRAFDLLHTEVWQALFIVLSISIWLLWAGWTLRIAASRA
ncbi:MAG TPA: hypothetical protein VII72_15475 [Myxococcota bacterium]|jgi:exosortase/archaeosortase family protein